MINTLKHTRGFTLIELLVVIAIIGILASVILASLNAARTRGNDAKRFSEIHTLKTALEAYYSDNGHYPEMTWACSSDSDWQTGALATALKNWLPTMPVDPINTVVTNSKMPWNTADAPTYYYGYCYYSAPPGNANWSKFLGKTYLLVYALENQNVALDTQTAVYDCTSAKWNYNNNDGWAITDGTSCPQ